MLPYKPDEWPAQFEKYIAAGDLDTAAALYASDASFVSPKHAIEVLRRQPDGTWLLAVGDPNGRG
jgi:ketosteroid isomerase-like protein